MRRTAWRAESARSNPCLQLCSLMSPPSILIEVESGPLVCSMAEYSAVRPPLRGSYDESYRSSSLEPAPVCSKAPLRRAWFQPLKKMMETPLAHSTVGGATVAKAAASAMASPTKKLKSRRPGRSKKPAQRPPLSYLPMRTPASQQMTRPGPPTGVKAGGSIDGDYFELIDLRRFV